MSDKIVGPEEWSFQQAARQGFFASGRRLIILIYALFGPPIGGILAIIIEYRSNLASRFSLSAFQDGAIQAILDLLSLPLAATFFGYFFGGIQALLTGLMLAALSDANGRFGYMKAVIAPSVIGLAAGFVMVKVWDYDLQLSAFLGGIGIAASVILRFLFRKRFGPEHRKK